MRLKVVCFEYFADLLQATENVVLKVVYYQYFGGFLPQLSDLARLAREASSVPTPPARRRI